jgi:hypothetical protein
MSVRSTHNYKMNLKWCPYGCESRTHPRTTNTTICLHTRDVDAPRRPTKMDLTYNLKPQAGEELEDTVRNARAVFEQGEGQGGEAANNASKLARTKEVEGGTISQLAEEKKHVAVWKDFDAFNEKLMNAEGTIPRQASNRPAHVALVPHLFEHYRRRLANKCAVRRLIAVHRRRCVSCAGVEDKKHLWKTLGPKKAKKFKDRVR